MSRVFISYRRADSAQWANELYGHLSMRFGYDLIFQDVDDIRAGSNWLKTIQEELRSCCVFLVLIGPHWLVDAEGHRRLDSDKDVLRLEVTEALSGDRTVIPLLVGGAAMPPTDDLPRPLKSLTQQQGLTLREDHWIPDVKALIERLCELVLPTIKQMPLRRANQEIYRMQQHYFNLLEQDAAEALQLAQKTQKQLDQALQLYPQDPDLKVTRGYLFKNEAMALGILGRYDEEGASLNKGEQVFRTMLKENPRDAGAWNGLGSIEGLRGEYKQAIEYIDRALEISPDYETARQDREGMVRMLTGQGQ